MLLSPPAGSLLFSLRLSWEVGDRPERWDERDRLERRDPGDRDRLADFPLLSEDLARLVSRCILLSSSSSGW